MSEDEEKVTLSIKNVSAKSRFIFNHACKHLYKDRGDVISDLMLEFVEEKLGSKYSSVWEHNYYYRLENQRELEEIENVPLEETFNSPSEALDEPSGLDCD